MNLPLTHQLPSVRPLGMRLLQSFSLTNNNQKPLGEWSQENEILKETSPSFRSVCYPKLQILVKMRFHTNLQLAKYGAAMS